MSVSPSFSTSASNSGPGHRLREDLKRKAIFFKKHRIRRIPTLHVGVFFEKIAFLFKSSQSQCPGPEFSVDFENRPYNCIGPL